MGIAIYVPCTACCQTRISLKIAETCVMTYGVVLPWHLNMILHSDYQIYLKCSLNGTSKYSIKVKMEFSTWRYFRFIIFVILVHPSIHPSLQRWMWLTVFQRKRYPSPRIENTFFFSGVGCSNFNKSYDNVRLNTIESSLHLSHFCHVNLFYIVVVIVVFCAPYCSISISSISSIGDVFLVLSIFIPYTEQW